MEQLPLALDFMVELPMVQLPMVALSSDHLPLSMVASDQPTDPMALDLLMLLLTPILLTVLATDQHLTLLAFIQTIPPLTIGHPFPTTHP